MQTIHSPSIHLASTRPSVPHAIADWRNEQGFQDRTRRRARRRARRAQATAFGLRVVARATN